MTGSALPRFATWFVVGAIVAVYAHAIYYMPIPHNDQFREIYYTLAFPPGKIFSNFLEAPGPVFRPGEWVMRYLIVYVFGPYPSSYNYFQILFVVLVGGLALYAISCRNWIDAGAAITAITFLFGHHAFPATIEGNNTFTNGLALLAMMAALPILQSKGGLSSQLLAIAMSVATVLTKEVGLVVPFTFIAAAILGFPGVRRWTALVLLVLTLAYLGFRFTTLPALLAETTAQGRAHTGSAYLANITASPIMIVTGEPYDGNWSEFVRRHFYPWRVIRIVLGLATVAIIFAAFCLRKAAAEAFPEDELVDWKWTLLLLGVVAASSAIAFHYTRHRFGGMALPVAYLVLYRSLRIVLWRLSSLDGRKWLRVTAGSLLFAFSLGWASRAADVFFALRYLGATTLVAWVEHYQDYRTNDGKHPESLPYLDSFYWAALELPWPTVQNDSSFVKKWLGERVMNR